MSPLQRFAVWRVRRANFRHLRWLRRNHCLLPAPDLSHTRRPGPEAVCCAVGALLLAGTAHAQGAVNSLDEPSTLGLALIGGGLWLVSRWPAYRFRDPRMSRRHPGQLCNCLACVEAFPDC